MIRKLVLPLDHAARCSLLVVSAMLGATWFAGAAVAESEPGPWSATLWYGRGTDTDFTQIVTQPWTTTFVDQNLVGISVARRMGTFDEFFDLGPFWKYLSLEVEGGAAYRFGDEEDLGEFWTSLYFRYDGFPWGDVVYTSIAMNTGWSFLTETSEWERRDNGDATQILHNFSPEITFANPDRTDIQLVLRLHHRSGIFGLVDGVSSGSSFITSGLRLRF